MVDDMAWWTIPTVSLVTFTLYGIEGIGSQLEDPFGYDRNDIKMDAIAGDTKTEIDSVLSEWRRVMKDASGDAAAQTARPGGLDEAKFIAPDLFLKSSMPPL